MLTCTAEDALMLLTGEDRFAMMKTLSGNLIDLLELHGDQLDTDMGPTSDSIVGHGPVRQFLTKAIPNLYGFVIFGFCGFFQPASWVPATVLCTLPLPDTGVFDHEAVDGGADAEVVVDWFQDNEHNFCVGVYTFPLTESLGAPHDAYAAFYARVRSPWSWVRYPAFMGIIAVASIAMIPPADDIFRIYRDVLTTKSKVLERMDRRPRDQGRERADVDQALALTRVIGKYAPRDFQVPLMQEMEGGIRRFFSADH
jgi:hypothetical protein